LQARVVPNVRCKSLRNEQFCIHRNDRSFRTVVQFLELARRQMSLRHSAIAGFFLALARIGAGLVTMKVLAVLTGPAGTALAAQMQSLVSIPVTAMAGGLGNGVIKYVSEHRADPERQAAFIHSALALCIGSGALFAAAMWVFSQPLALLVLGSPKYAGALGVAAAAISFLIVNGMLTSLLNGLQDIPRYALASAAGIIVGASIVWILTFGWGLKGALTAVAIGQAPALAITAVLVARSGRARFAGLFRGPDIRASAMLGRFVLMSCTTAALVPTSHIIVRNFLMHELSPEAAGYWQGMARISEVYLFVITSALTTYYLPRLSEVQDKAGLRREIGRGLAIFVPLAALGALAIFLLKSAIVEVVFTPRFAPMEVLFGPQVLGDVLKIASYLLAMLMLAKSMTRFYVVSEVAFVVLFVLLSFAFTRTMGLVGMAWGHVALHLAYLATLAWRMRRVLF
jgi:polysaccharide transporter, PST family